MKHIYYNNVRTLLQNNNIIIITKETNIIIIIINCSYLSPLPLQTSNKYLKPLSWCSRGSGRKQTNKAITLFFIINYLLLLLIIAYILLYIYYSAQ